ncbi:MAG: hypothetical protein ACLFU7_10880, partial [Armatimonadota bacterium]
MKRGGARRQSALMMILIVAGIMGLVLAGCSGGHGPTVPSPDGPGNGGPDDGNGDGPGNGEITDGETVAAVESYGDRYAEMLNDDMTIPDAIEQLAAEMEASGDFSAVEIDGTGQIIWAEFTNGWPYAVLGNRTAESDEVADDRAEAQVAAAEQMQSADAVELPASTDAV